MRAVFLTQNAPFYIGRYFDRIFARSAGGPAEIVRLYAFPSHLPGKGTVGTLWYYFRSYYGPGLFLRLGVKRVWMALRDGLGLGRRADSLRRVCRRHGVPFAAPKRLDECLKRELRDLRPDVLFSVGCPVILKRDVIAIPRRACLNIHSALLPKYRGANPVFWALYHGEREIGVTVHLVIERIDAGGILAQERIPMPDGWTIDDAYEPIFEVGSRMIAECLSRLAAEPGAPAARPMDPGPYCGFPTRAQVREFRRRGRRFFS